MLRTLGCRLRCASALARPLCLPAAARCLSTAPAAKYPTLEVAAEASKMRVHHEMSNELLINLAASGDNEACTERFIREVMHVDQIEWPDAKAKVDGFTQAEMSTLCPAPSLLWNIIGGSVVVSGFASIPMVFSHDLTMWTNKHYVSFTNPPEADIDTILEVGSWAWGWMEPPLGTISFVILCWQLGIQQMSTRTPQICPEVKAVISQYPQYNYTIVRAWAESVKETFS